MAHHRQILIGPDDRGRAIVRVQARALSSIAPNKANSLRFWPENAGAPKKQTQFALRIVAAISPFCESPVSFAFGGLESVRLWYNGLDALDRREEIS